MPHHPPPLPCLPLRRHKPPALSACAHSAPPTADRKKQRHTLAEATTSSPLCGHFDTPYRTLPKPFPRRSARERHFAHGAIYDDGHTERKHRDSRIEAYGKTITVNFPQQSRSLNIAHQNPFYRICNITPTSSFQLRHYRYSNSNIHDTITHIKHRKRFPRNPSITPPCIPL